MGRRLDWKRNKEKQFVDHCVVYMTREMMFEEVEKERKRKASQTPASAATRYAIKKKNYLERVAFAFLIGNRIPKMPADIVAIDSDVEDPLRWAQRQPEYATILAEVNASIKR
jgi:hypothetical protein